MRISSRLRAGFLGFALLGLAVPVAAQTPATTAPPDRTGIDAGLVDGRGSEVIDRSTVSTEWFQNARFGMFIHWGLYSAAGGEWQGRRYYGIAEWLMRRAEIPTAEYARIADTFNPVGFDADQWTEAAKDAGIQYIIITAKHHDGFAMFDSAATEYDIVDATPFGRDPMRELADAAAKRDIRLGFYYSQYQDWAEPNADGNTWEFPAQGRDFQAYLDSKAIPQLRELLTNYGNTAIIWFDTPRDITLEASLQLRDVVRTASPNTLIGSRIGHGLGDYRDMADAEVPPGTIDEYAWQALFTHNDSWGFSRFDRNFKSSEDLIRLLSTVASRGGNLLLNVGPDGEGRMPQETVDAFGRIGDWLEVNGEAIYGTRGSPIGEAPWGVATSRPGVLYLHVLDAPEDGRLIVPNAGPAQIQSVGVLGGRSAPWTRAGDDLVVTLPERTGEAGVSVVAVRYAGDTPSGDPQTILSRQFEQLALDPGVAVLGGGATRRASRSFSYFGVWEHFWTVDGLTGPEASLHWPVRVLEPGRYHVEIEYAATREQAGREGVVQIGDESIPFQVVETDEIETGRPPLFFRHPIGVVEIDEAGTHNLTIRAEKQAGQLFTIHAVTLRPYI
jgi:alpha-L-fucosidase